MLAWPGPAGAERSRRTLEARRLSHGRVQFVMKKGSAENPLFREYFDLNALRRFSETDASTRAGIPPSIGAAGWVSGVAAAACIGDLIDAQATTIEWTSLGAVSALAATPVAVWLVRANARRRAQRDRELIKRALDGDAPRSRRAFTQFLNRLQRALARVDQIESGLGSDEPVVKINVPGRPIAREPRDPR